MARLGGAGNDSGGRGVATVQLNNGLKDKLILALLAVIVGGGGAAGYMNVNPPRPDPFTGAEGKRLESRIVALEILQGLDNQHRSDAVGGWQRIRKLEQQVSVCINKAEESSRIIRSMERKIESHQ